MYRNVRRPHVLGNVYFSASHAIDDHNRVRQDLFRLEFVWLTTNCWAACVRGLLAMIVVDCYYAQKAYQKDRHKRFRDALLELVNGLLKRGMTAHDAAAEARSNGPRVSPRHNGHYVQPMPPQLKSRKLNAGKRGSGSLGSRNKQQGLCAMCKTYKTSYVCSKCTVELPLRSGNYVNMPLCQPGIRHSGDLCVRTCFELHKTHDVPKWGKKVLGPWHPDWAANQPAGDPHGTPQHHAGQL